jgi:hypothetical protein
LTHLLFQTPPKEPIRASIRRLASVSALFLAFFLLLRFLANGEALVLARNVFFTDYVADSGLFLASPDALSSRGFLVDSPEDIFRFQDKLRSLSLGNPTIDSIAAIGDVVERAKAVVLSFSRAGFAGRCGTSDDLTKKLQEAIAGHGCCSDHSKLFQAVGSVAGLFTRELQSSNHALGTFFDIRSGKWIFIDPTFAILATAADGAYLSAYELRERMLHGGFVKFVFFGGPKHPHAMSDAAAQAYYRDPADFGQFVLTGGNNVMQQEHSLWRIRFLPKPVAQLVLQISGTRPRFWSLNDKSAERDNSHKERLKIVMLLGSSAAALVALLWVIAPLLSNGRLIHDSNLPKAG